MVLTSHLLPTNKASQIHDHLSYYFCTNVYSGGFARVHAAALRPFAVLQRPNTFAFWEGLRFPALTTMTAHENAESSLPQITSTPFCETNP